MATETTPTALNSKPTRLRRTTSLLLSILTPGLGHVVLGSAAKGLKWYAGFALMMLAFLVSANTGPRHFVWLFFAAALIIRLLAIADIFRIHSVGAQSWKRLTAIVVFLVAIDAVLGEISLRLLHAYRQPTSSMYPTIEVGDHFMASFVLGTLHRGDVIFFDYPLDRTKYYVKRIIGLPGDTVELRNGRLILNGKAAEMRASDNKCRTLETKCTIWWETIGGKTYQIALMDDFSHAESPFSGKVVPSGQLFVLGDNRDNSADSRYWGYVPIDLVRGKPKFIYWSSLDGTIRWNRINQVID